MVYKILPYTYDKARELGVLVYPSDNPKYKLEVYDDKGKFICYVGAMGYKDFPTFIQTQGYNFALKRRELYKKRHEKDRHKVGSKGWFADQLLW